MTAKVEIDFNVKGDILFESADEEQKAFILLQSALEGKHKGLITINKVKSLNKKSFETFQPVAITENITLFDIGGAL